ncbi:MAG: hypothetical protein M3O32_00005, partial [Actinomycetota bacterium]|nr:hypothetical protein [Actinomycetota bacterium]
MPDTFTQSSQGSFSTSAGRGTLNGSVKVTVTALPPSVAASGQPIDTWRVERTDSAGTMLEVYDLVHASSSAASAIAPGIYLVGLAWNDPVRGSLTFVPVGTGLEIIPDPVQVAQNAAQYVGSATDPNT